MARENNKSTRPRDRNGEPREFAPMDEQRKGREDAPREAGKTDPEQNRKLGKRHDESR